jgi:DsbC/DsbD-like thiol-disulfide interchange protein
MNADFTGKARLATEISWLACGEDGCVPGKAEIHLDLTAGTPAPAADSREILTAHQ